jgi:RHS repeat-associated protein
MDGDRRTDVVITTAAGLAIGYNLNGKDWTVPQTIGIVDAKQTLRFSDGHTQICDINGDRVQDLCYLRSGGLIFYLGRGRGIFEAGREATGVPNYDVSSPWQLVDLNGDGWTDLVHVGVDQIDFALATSAGVFGAPSSIAGTPSKLSTTQVEFADMNGSGTTDIVWIDISGSPDKAWQYLELFPNGRAGLLKTIDNGLGKVTRISYAAAARGAAAARDNGTPWTTRMNVGMPVVSEVRLESALGDPTIVTDFGYNNGTWDPNERTFAGFGEGIQTEIGDSSTPTSVTDSTFDTGVMTRVMRGQPLTSEQRDAKGYMFSRSTSGYTLRDLETALDGRRVHYAFKSSEQLEHIEGKDTSLERITLTEWEQDQYGNVTKESKWGEVVSGDKLGGNDESIAIRTYANNTDDWLLGYLASEEVQDVSGNRFKFTRNYYDGTAFQGLALGQVARGDLTRSESWISADHFANENANQFDADGNITANINAHGGRSEYEYDSESHAFVVEERMFPDIDHRIEWHAKFDGRWGAITEFTTPNGAVTSVSYDALGRVTSVVSPGDSAERPTTAFEYRFGMPTSLVTTRSRERSGEDGVILRVGHVDGFGRKRAEFQEAAYQGQWILSGFNRLDARSQVAFTAYPTLESSADMPTLSGVREGTSSLRDALGRELYTQYPDGAESRIDYAPFSTTTWDENDTDQSSVHKNTPTTHNQDGLGRLVSVIEREGTRAITTGTYAYSPIGSVTQIADALGHTRTYGYDGRGRRTTINDPNGGAWKLAYTDGNDLEERTDPTGNAVRFSYDNFGRSLKELHQLAGKAETLAVEYHYDEPSAEHPNFGETKGLLAWLEDEAGREYYGYDARGRSTDTIRRWQDGTEHHTWNDFDSLGRVTRRGFPDKTHLSMSYDARGLLNQLGPIASNITWMPHGALESYKLGTGLTEKRTYDNRRRLVTMSATDSKGSVVRGLRYGLDAASRIVELADLRTTPPADEDLTAAFQYDDRYRLTSATYRTGATTWQPDDLAKILTVKSDFGDPHLNVTNTYGENGAGPDALTHHGTETLSYDEAGRVTKDGERSYEWDAKGRLAKVTRGNTVEEYLYGHDGTRAVKLTTVDGKTEVTRYIEKDVEERNGTLVRYAYFGDQRLARLDPVDVGPRTAPVTKTGSVALGAGNDNSNPSATSTLAPRMARAYGTSLGISALLIGLLIWLQVIANKRTQKLPAYALRLGTVAISMGLLCLGGLGIQACASNGGTHPPSFREQSTEITAVPEGAEFYLADAQQSPLAVVSKAASVLSRTALHPFGHVRFQAGKTGDPWGFVGNEEDRGSGISDFHARPYRAELGVFLAVDPLALLSPEKTIGSAARLFAYAYAASDPITQSDPNGLTPGDIVRGMWDQGIENVKNAAVAVAAAAKSTAAQALRGDIAGAGMRVVKGVADGLDQAFENVVTFGDDFVKAATAPSDYESGRLSVKPVTTAMALSSVMLGPRVGTSRAGASKATVSKGKQGIAARDLRAEAAAARDKLATDLAGQKHPPATVVGAYSESTGQVTAGASRGRGLGCAEGVCDANLGHPGDSKFTTAIRPRTGETVPVCPNCEANYGRGAFPSDAAFKSNQTQK